MVYNNYFPGEGNGSPAVLLAWSIPGNGENLSGLPSMGIRAESAG